MSAFPPYVTEAVLTDLIRRALEEDVGAGDVTTQATIPEGMSARGVLTVREAGVVAGLIVAERVFRTLDPEVEVHWQVHEGQLAAPGTVLGTVEGNARALLSGERVALNILQRMSGIATLTRRMVEAVRPYRAVILDTRKTAPGLRVLDKWAVRLGGGQNHRLGLFDMVLIKDNHIAVAGGITRAVERVKAHLAERGLNLPIEVEARTLAEVAEVARLEGIDRVLLDNMVTLLPDGRVDTHRLEEAVQIIGGRIPTEASGGVTLETVHFIAAAGVDYISCGVLTHSPRALDISMRVEVRAPSGV